MLKAAIALVVAFVLAACAPDGPNATQVPLVPGATQVHLPTVGGTQPVAPQATAAVSSTIPASLAVHAPPSQTVPAVQGVTFAAQSIGISFIYPAEWEILPRALDEPPGVTIHSPELGEGPEPIIFAITVDIESATEQSVKDIVDQQLEQVPTELSGASKRRVLDVGGEPAEQVIGLPSLQGALETFVLHRGHVYLIILQPYDESNESLLPYLVQERTAYEDLLASWRFLK